MRAQGLDPVRANIRSTDLIKMEQSNEYIQQLALKWRKEKQLLKKSRCCSSGIMKTMAMTFLFNDPSLRDAQVLRNVCYWILRRMIDESYGRTIPLWHRVWVRVAAASVLLVAGVSGYFLVQKCKYLHPRMSLLKASLYKTWALVAIRLYCYWGNGEQIRLDDMSNGTHCDRRKCSGH